MLLKILRIFSSISFLQMASTWKTSASTLSTCPRFGLAGPPSRPWCSSSTKSTSFSWTFLASSSSSRSGSLETTIDHACTSGGQWPGFSLAKVSSAATALSNATRPLLSRFRRPTFDPVMTLANCLKASGAASEKLARGAARLMAYAAAVLASGSAFASASTRKTSGMKTGHTGSDCSLRWWIRSQPMYRPRTLLSRDPTQHRNRSAHWGKQGKNCCGATSITAPRTSS
mmetsp:Transcript_139299/g.388748  ORF Transcript_139299/g.388748 Transcript_139299/m.388748 type:complete len:229 (+) Transcript_139299:254-940(+)